MYLKQTFFMAVFVSCFFLVGLQAVSAADWKPAGNSEFDASRITRVSPSVIRVWERATWSEQTLFQIQTVTGLNYTHYSHSIDLRQVDCKRHLLGGLNNTDYDKRGSVIRSEKYPKVIMNEQPPGSGGEAFINTVCDFVNKKKR